MLKIYNTLDEVPEGLREHYKKSDGRYVPDLSDDHPVVAHNKTLLSEKSTATAKVKELEADIEASKDKHLQRGQVAVAKADAELIDKYKPLGTPDELTAMKTEHGTLKSDLDKRKRQDAHTVAAKELGYNVDAFLRLPDMPELEVREKDGKKSVVAKVKDGENIVEKPAKEFIEANYAALMPALQAKAGVTLPVGGGSGEEGQGQDPFKWARDYGKEYAEQSKPITDTFAEFNKRQSA